MNDQIKTDFLRKRMVQLREKNGYNLSQLADKMNINKSILSRAEKIGGPTTFSTVLFYAKEYCKVFELSDVQEKLFLRGERAVVVDTSALFQRPDVLNELGKEYSCVFVPNFVIEDLRIIKNDNANEYGTRALELLKRIKNSEGIQTKKYSIPNKNGIPIVDIAEVVAEEMACKVDILTSEVDLALEIKGCIREDSPFSLLFLEEYVATQQKLVNMSVLNSIKEYYADSYDDIEDKLNIKLPAKDSGEWNCFLSNGLTLIISAVKDTEHPKKQRMEKIKWLVQNGADINKRDCESKNFPPITHAVKLHDYEMFHFILFECNANPNVGSRNPYDVGKIRQKNDGNMPLMVAAWENQIEMVRDLCSDKRVSLNQQDGNGYTALIKACYWGNKECRELIEKAGADTTILDHEGLSAEDRWDECIELGRYKERISD